MNKKKIIILVLVSIVVATACYFAASYGFYVISANKTLEMNTTTNTPSCIGLTITNSSTLTLEGDYMVPISDEQFFNSSTSTQEKFKYSFTVSNDCEEEKNLSIGFVNLTQSTKLISSLKYLLVENGSELNIAEAKKITDGSIANISKEIQQYLINTYSVTSSTTYKMLDVTVGANERKIYDLYVWLAQEADNEVMDQSLKATVILYNEDIG